jgi:hypothetical protein
VRFRTLATALICVLAVAILSGQRRDAFVASRNHPAIDYTNGELADPVSLLSRRVAAGTETLAFDPVNGYLPAILKALNVPVESQMLVFSQTSFQGPLINIHNPRALYFNDTVSVGWVRGGPLLEIAAQDPVRGVVFYAVDQSQGGKPVFTRDTQCLACHLSWETLGVPGLTVQSVYPLPDENSYVNGFTTVHGSPLEQRWGGWWVTGDTGGAKHMGNIPVMPADKGRAIANPLKPLPSVEGIFDQKGYLSSHSDVVALLVMEHQAHMTNLITRTGWEARLADADGTESARTRVTEAAVDLVDYMLFVTEAPLVGAVQGSSAFAKVFSAQGPRDAQGRSLREFDLRRRLFRYPCSYMIYTPAFEALPASAKAAVYGRLWSVLSGTEKHARYRALSRDDRRAIVDILRQTKTDLPDAFGGAVQ